MSGQIKRIHPREQIPEERRVNSDVPGVSFSYKRQSFRAKFQQDGQSVQKYFKVTGDDALSCQQREAELWRAGVNTGTTDLALQDK